MSGGDRTYENSNNTNVPRPLPRPSIHREQMNHGYNDNTDETNVPRPLSRPSILRKQLNHQYNNNGDETNIWSPLPRPSIHRRSLNSHDNINNGDSIRKRLIFTDVSVGEDHYDNGHDDVDSFPNYNRDYNTSYDDIDALRSNRRRLNERIRNLNSSLFRNEIREVNNNTGAWNYLKGGLILILPILLAIYTSIRILETDPINNTYDNIAYKNDLGNISTKYNDTGEITSRIQMVAYMISQKEDTDSFMFLYNSKLANFSASAFDGFVDIVASSTAKFLRNDQSVHPVAVDSTSLSIEDSTELIEAYKDNVKKNAVLLVKNLDKLPSSLAMALHYYCDEYSPLVKKSAIFSTFDFANCVEQTFSYQVIERCLERKWHTIPQNKIQPLIARVVSIVIDLTDVSVIKNE